MVNFLQRLTSFIANNYILENSEKPKCTVNGNAIFIPKTIYKPEHWSVVVAEEIFHDTSDIYSTKIVLLMYAQQHCIHSKYHYFYIHWLNIKKKTVFNIYSHSTLPDCLLIYQVSAWTQIICINWILNNL